MNSYFAHAGELHEDSVQAAQHSFELNPLIGSLLAIGIIALFTYLVFVVTKSSTATTFSLLAQLLVIGLLTYSVLPFISGLFIVIGFFLSFFLAFGGMSAKNKSTK